MSKLALALLLSFAPTLLGQNGYITTVTVPGSGTSAMTPGMIAVDGADNLYIPNRSANAVGKIDAVTGNLTIVAGNGTAGSTGDGGPATQASLNGPSAVAVDIHGNLYIAEAQGNRVRRVDAATGIITTYAGTSASGFSGDGGLATSGTLFTPLGLALDTAGNLYIADTNNYRIRRVDASTGILTTVAGTGVNAHAPDGTPAINASLALPAAVSFDPQGNLLISEVFGYDIRRVTNGILTTFAGNGGNTFNGDGEPATSAALGMVGSNVAADRAGNLYFADGIGRVRRVDAVTGNIVTVAGNGSGAHTQSSSGGGSGGGSYNCPANLGDGGPATLATLDGVVGVAMTSTGRLLMSDYIDCRVRSVTLPSPLQYTNTSLTLTNTTLTVVVSPIAGSGVPTGTVQFMAAQSAGGPLPITSAPLVNGTATLDTGALPAGSGNLIAIYTGDTSYNGSASVVMPVTGGGKATPQFASNVPTPVLANTPVTIQVGVNGSRGFGTGAVSLYEGSTFLTTASLVNGVGTFQYSATVSGTHQITVQYPGDANYIPATWTFSFPVTAPSTVALTVDNNPANTGATVTFTATVSPSTATGQVTFSDATSGLLGSSTISGGIATFSASFQSAGTHPINASYGGNAVLAPSTSAYLYETVNAAPTSLTLTGSGTPSTYGQSVTFTATITPPAAGGPIYFYDGYTQIGIAQVNNGSATFTTAALAVGTHSITAGYAGTSTYASSASPAVTQTVNKAATTAALVSASNPSNVGQSVVFTATLTPSAATGTVQFLDGTTVLATIPVTSGAASFTTTTLAAGTHSIAAVYSGDSNYNGVTSAAVSQTVNKIAATATLSTSTGNIVYGQTVDLTAAVAPAAATGTVQFLDGASVLVTLPVTNGSVPVVTATNLTAGTHSFTAVYSGDSTYTAGTSAAATVTVSKVNATVALTSSANPSINGQTVLFTATLAPANATGNLQFLDGATVLATVAATNGVASFTTSTLSIGTHSVTVAYAGDTNCNPATSAVLTQTVNKLATTTTLTASPTTLVYGQTVTLNASIPFPGPTGTMQFFDGATPLGTAALVSSSATLNVSTLAAGSHSITAVYSGDANDTTSTSSPVTVSVSKVNTTAGLTASPNPSIAGQPVTFTAAVSPSSSTGTVQFLDGASVIGSAPVANGSASLSVALSVGTHSVTAVYSGDANYNGATSAAVLQTVNKASSTTTISGAGTVSFGQSVSITAIVSPASATGSVQFLDGATVIGSVALSGGSATLIVGNFAVGTHTITATYGGDAATLASTSGAASVTVVKAATAVGLASSLDPSLQNHAVTFTAQVSPAGATGTVKFYDGATVIGTVTIRNGVASVTVSNLAPGSHSITAVYGGDASYTGATSAALTQSVLIATRTTLNSNKSIANQGQAVKFTANVSPGGATGAIAFMDGATVLATVPLTGDSAVLQLSNLTVGTHTITAAYSGAAKYATSTSAPVTVTVH